MRKTLKDIAREVNLSVNTVSRALRGFPGVSEQNRKRIEETARKLNYVPNGDARSLVLNRTNSIGLLVPNLRVPFFGEITIFIQQMLQEKGYFSYVLNTNEDNEQTYSCICSLIERKIEGVISIGAIPPSSLDALKTHRIPEVVLVVPGSSIPQHFVGYDDEIGGYMAARHLLDLGHRKIAYFTGQWDADLDRPSPRHRGFLKAFGDRGDSVEAMTLGDVFEDTIKAGYECSAGLVKRIAKREIDAVFCVCDAVALGLMHRLNEKGLIVPEDVSIIGYDNIEMTEFSIPPLTTISQDAERIARLGTSLLLQLLGSAEDWSSIRHQVFLEPILIIRKSTAPPIRK